MEGSGAAARRAPRRTAPIAVTAVLVAFLIAFLVVVALPAGTGAPRSGDVTLGGPVPPEGTSDFVATVVGPAVSTLGAGTVAFDPPGGMRQDESTRVVASLSELAATGDTARATAPRPGAPETVPFGPVVEASLVGDGFRIESLDAGGGSRRYTGVGRAAQWAWDVKPSDAGSRSLTLAIQIYVPESSEPAATRFVVRPTRVERDYLYSLGSLLSSPAWAATGLSVPVVAAAAVAVVRARSRRERSTPDPPVSPRAPEEPAPPAEREPRGYL